MNLAKVSGKQNLYRDMSTGAIINTDKTEYLNYMEMKRIKEQEKSRINSIEKEVSEIKTDLNEIKDLLRSFINESR